MLILQESWTPSGLKCRAGSPHVTALTGRAWVAGKCDKLRRNVRRVSGGFELYFKNFGKKMRYIGL